LNEEAVMGYDTCCKMAPPLRTKEDVEALRDGLAKGIIDVIATDHAPHGQIDKAIEFDQAANGIIGVQTAIPLTLRLVHEGKLSLSRWVEAWTSAPAQILRKPFGTLKVGAEADVTILNPEHAWTFTEDSILSKSQNSPFIGWKFKGGILKTIVNGKVVYE
jgi:dihydroorotase